MLGPPDKVDRDSEDLPLLKYNYMRATFWFDARSRLHWIECCHPNLTTFGRKLIGTDGEESLTFLKGHLEEPPELEDYGSFESYHFRKSELEVQVEYGLVQTINFGHLWAHDRPVFAAQIKTERLS